MQADYQIAEIVETTLDGSYCNEPDRWDAITDVKLVNGNIVKLMFGVFQSDLMDSSLKDILESEVVYHNQTGYWDTTIEDQLS